MQQVSPPAGSLWIVRTGEQAPQIVDSLLRLLPTWFGIESSNAGYVEAAKTMPTYLAWPRDDSRPSAERSPLGVLLLDRHFPQTGEIHLLAVAPSAHRHGAGRALVEAAERDLAADGATLLQVKTLGPAHPDPGYAKTRLFYEALGFIPVEEILDLWPGNPCLIMIKVLPRASADTSDLTLRPAVESDLELIERLTGDPTMTGDFEWNGWQDPRHWRRRWEQDGMLSDDGGILMVARQDQALGFKSWRKRQNGRAYYWEMGTVLAPQERGRGYGTWTHRALVRYLFGTTTVNRIEARTEVENLAAQRALEKAGFTREGVLRGIGFRAGQWRDGLIYSILRSEVEL
jgi:RimJ/RimL family protein N-acetyltransferase